MKKILGVAAAALLLSAGAASATSKVTNLTIDINFGSFSAQCPLTVTQTTDGRRINTQIVLGAQSTACSFDGGGLIGAADNTGKTNLSHVAVISGYSGLAVQYANTYNLTVLLQLSSTDRFKSGLKYWVYSEQHDANGNLTTPKYLGNGTYTVN